MTYCTVYICTVLGLRTSRAYIIERKKIKLLLGGQGLIYSRPVRWIKKSCKVRKIL